MKKKINGGTTFFLIVVMLYLIAFLIEKDYTSSAFMGFLNTMKGILPLIIGVFFVMFLVNIFLDPKKINKHLGHDSGIKGWIYTIIAGVLIPAPPYVVFPLLGDLKKKGMKDALIVSFLYNRNLQITFLPVMAYYFGIPFTIIICAHIFIFAIISGLIIEKTCRTD